MAANISPVFTLTPFIGVGSLSIANTSRDGTATGTYAIVATGSAYGSRVDSIYIKALVTTTAGMVRLFVVDDVPALSLWKEVPIPITTGSSSGATYEYTLALPGESALILPNGWSLRASTEKAEAIKVFAKGGTF